jgi:hypothetical protein
LLRKDIKRAAPVLIYSEHLAGDDGDAMFRHACAMGLEGNRLEAGGEPVSVRHVRPQERSTAKVRAQTYRRPRW